MRRLRILWILLGACLLIWLQLEDASERWVLLFAAAICTMLAAQAWQRLARHRVQQGYWFPLAGLLVGLLITPVALSLMALKTGLHGHQGPDFSGEQILAVIMRTPFWIASGLITGSGIQLFQQIKPPQETDQNQL